MAGPLRAYASLVCCMAATTFREGPHERWLLAQEVVHAKLREVYAKCGLDGDAGLTSVQMVAGLEAKLEELLLASEQLTPEAVLAGQRAREAARRKVCGSVPCMRQQVAALMLIQYLAGWNMPKHAYPARRRILMRCQHRVSHWHGNVVSSHAACGMHGEVHASKPDRRPLPPSHHHL